MWQQVIAPNPNVPCTPGWCLKYVKDAFGVTAVYPTAIAAWIASQNKHQDRDFPASCWVAIWFSLAKDPRGHVALLAPDGSVYSSSSATATRPVHHASINALLSYYAAVNPLTYLGWTEDVEGTIVVKKGELVMNEEAAKGLYRMGLFREPENDQVWRPWVGKPADEGMRGFMASDEWKRKRDYVNKYPDLLKENEANRAKVADLQKQVADLTAQLKDKGSTEAPAPGDGVSVTRATVLDYVTKNLK